MSYAATMDYRFSVSEGVLCRRPQNGAGVPEILWPDGTWHVYWDKDVLVAPWIDMERAIRLAGSEEALYRPASEPVLGERVTGE